MQHIKINTLYIRLSLTISVPYLPMLYIHLLSQVAVILGLDHSGSIPVWHIRPNPIPSYIWRPHPSGGSERSHKAGFQIHSGGITVGCSVYVHPNGGLWPPLGQYGTDLLSYQAPYLRLITVQPDTQTHMNDTHQPPPRILTLSTQLKHSWSAWYFLPLFSQRVY